MRILLFGASGQLGRELARVLSSVGQLVCLTRKSKPLCGDLSRLELLEQTVALVRPNVIVNAAAYTAVDQAETCERDAYLTNADAAKVLASEAKKSNALLVHYSTDYVFNGEGTEFLDETVIPAPLNVYGASKWAGEQRIIESGCDYLIFRTSWVYSFHGKNFLKTVLRLCKEKPSFGIVSDEIGTPTSTSFLAEVILYALGIMKCGVIKTGLYHLVPRGTTSWFDYACYVLECAKEVGFQPMAQKILPIDSKSFGGLAKRPHNSRLDSRLIQQTFKLDFPDWQDDVRKVTHQLVRNYLV